jgi:predicted CoA-substrate-specific enzyme activase
MAESVYTMGMDVGSTASKCVILRDGTALAGSAVVAAGTGTSGPARAMAQALEQAGLTREQIALLAATGYGRNTTEDADLRISELSCHAKGAWAAFPGVRTVIDIGGQDAKTMAVGENGRLENFMMNDKCAAGTGRFLDVMARVLELDVSQLGEEDAKSTQTVNISSTCTVFAESEVISQLSRKTPIPDLVAGIHRSVATRTASLAKRLGVRPPVVMTGGVAQNPGVVRALERELGVTIQVAPDAQLIGAYGAALMAFEKI